MSQLTFSGHDTFHCRPYWLKRGHDFLAGGKQFPDDDATVSLGVGKNMVTAIRYWMKAFGMVDGDERISELAHKLLADNGWDPYLEDLGSYWLLHYLLNKTGHASIYPLIFSELREERPEFAHKHFADFVMREKGEYNPNTLKSDFSVFCRTYHGNKDHKNLEESFTGILTDLQLLQEVKRGKETAYLIDLKKRPEIPAQILLFAILNQTDGNSISFEPLYNGEYSVGLTFGLSRDGLTEKLEQIGDLSKNIVFSNKALQSPRNFKTNPSGFPDFSGNHLIGSLLIA